VAWLLIILLESVHGMLRQKFLAPALGDLPSRQLGVHGGSILIFAVALATTGWLGAASTRTLFTVKCVWVLLTLVFEAGLGLTLGVYRASPLRVQAHRGFAQRQRGWIDAAVECPKFRTADADAQAVEEESVR
jgi:hypothetical protein